MIRPGPLDYPPSRFVHPDVERVDDEPWAIESKYGGMSRATPHSPTRTLAPQPSRRAPIRTKYWNIWLPLFGAAFGLMWAGFAAIFIGFGPWMAAPIVVGAVLGGLFGI